MRRKEEAIYHSEHTAPATPPLCASPPGEARFSGCSQLYPQITMSIAASQLGEIYTLIRETFRNHPILSVTPLQGDPPDKYELTCHLAGKSRDEHGEIVETTEHRIEIAIPFGFPHFPPNCRPLSPIFHPDFDEEAIHIGDFWNQDRTVPELIIELARMINGENYSTFDAFNTEAATWYQQHSSEFPLAEITWSGTGSAEATQPAALPPEPEEEEGLTLELTDEELDLELDSLSDCEESEEPPAFLSFNAEEEEVETRTALLQQMKNDGEFIRLRNELEGQADFSSELKPLYDEAVRRVQQAEKQYAEAKEAEEKEEIGTALALYQAVADSVSDFPAIQTDVSRLRDMQAFMAEIGMSSDSSEEAEETVTSGTQQGKTAAERKLERESRKSDRKQIQPPPQFMGTGGRPIAGIQAGRPLAPRLLLGGLLLSLAAATPIGLNYYSGMQVDEGSALLNQCTDALEAAQYKQAQAFCRQSIQSAEGVVYFEKRRSADIISKAREILGSELLKVGLAGKTLIDGQAFDPKDARKILAFRKKKEFADRLYLDKNFQEAAINYSDAIQLAKQLSFLDEETRLNLKNQNLSSLLQYSLQIADIQKRAKEWGPMLQTMQHATKRLESLPETERESFQQAVDNHLFEATLGTLRQKADHQIQEEQWDDAIATWNEALALTRKYPASGQKYEDELQAELLRTDLYKTLADGNKAFDEGKWDDAIASYGRADKILSGQLISLDAEASRKSKQRLGKIILQASLIRGEESARGQLDNAELRSARDTYRNLLKLIQGSNMKKEPQFVQAGRDIRKKIAELDHQLYLNGKIAWLKKNYRKLFARYYSTVNPKQLTDIQVKKTKETDSYINFRMQCTEKQLGIRPLTLILKYQLNKKNGKWLRITE